MKERNKDALKMGLAVTASVTLMPMIFESSAALCRLIFNRPESDDLYEVDIDSDDYYDEDEDDEDEEDEKHDGPGDENIDLVSQLELVFEQASPEQKRDFLRTVVAGISSTKDEKSDEEDISKDEEKESELFQQEAEKEEAVTMMDISDDQQIYLDRTSKYDSLLDEKEFAQAYKDFPEIHSILISCEEKNMTVEQTRALLRSSLRGIKIDKYQKEHPQQYHGKKRNR